MRPIDADRLKAVLEKNFGHTGGASVLEQLIDKQPTIESERKKGKWERASFYNDTPVCSECYLEGRWDWDFCPNCGADMRGEGAEEEDEQC